MSLKKSTVKAKDTENINAQDVIDIKTTLTLENVDNTSDANKPISTNTQNALNLKADDSSISSVGKSGNHSDLNLNDGTNPHNTNKNDVGLGNVDNTSDLNKPVSNFTQNALNDKVNKVAGKGLSDENYTLSEKNKLAGIESGAEANIPETITNLSITGNTLTYVNENGTSQNIDLSIYLDNTNLARIISGEYVAVDDVLRFTRDDGSTFDVDASMFFNDTNSVTSVNTQTGDVVLDADDIDDLTTTNKFTLQSDIDRLANTSGTNTGDQDISGISTNASDINNLQNNKVDKVVGKGLTDENYTLSEKNKLAGVESGAEANTVDSVNTQTGNVVLDADDFNDTTTANKFTTQADIDRLANTSGTNTGDQDLSVYPLKSNVLELDNSVIYTPTLDYHPATVKYVNDSISSTGGGDMLKSTYDTDNDGIVDNAQALNGSTGAFYLDRTNHTGTQTASTISDFDTEVSNNTDVSSTKASIGDLTYTPDTIYNLTYANGTYDFGSNILKYANVIDLESELVGYDPAIYHGMTIHVHETGALYYAHAGAWRKLLTDTTYNSVSGYTDSLSALAYSGDYTDLINTPVLATVASTGSYNDLIDTPTLAAVASTGDYTDLINKPDLSVLNDTIIEPTLNDFPATGSLDVVYIAEDTGYMYRWNGTGYTQLTDQTAIWGNISGTLSAQTDLQNALDSKADVTDLDSYVDLTTNQTVGGVKNFTGNIGVKTASPTEDFEVTGNQRINIGSLGVNVAPNVTDGTISASGDVIAFASDSRLKTNSKDIDKPLDKVKALRGFTYNWNELAKDKAGFDTTQKQVGVSAQDVQKTLPEAVKLAPFDNDGNDKSISGEDYLTVQYDKIVPLLIEAIKEQQTQIEELKKLIK